MIQHVKAKRAARQGKRLGDGSELFGDWDIQYPKAAWNAFILMDSTEWRHLPDGGGYFNQDESLMEDVTILTRMASYVEAQMDANETLGGLGEDVNGDNGRA